MYLSGRRFIRGLCVFYGGIHFLALAIYSNGSANSQNPAWVFIYPILHLEYSIIVWTVIAAFCGVVVFVILAIYDAFYPFPTHSPPLEDVSQKQKRHFRNDEFTARRETGNATKEEVKHLPAFKKTEERLTQTAPEPKKPTPPPKEFTPTELKEMAIKDILGGD